MQQFVPFEDEWDVLDRYGEAALMPFQLDVPCARGLRGRGDGPIARAGATAVPADPVELRPTGVKKGSLPPSQRSRPAL